MKEKENVAAYNRLVGKKTKLETEYNNEKKVEAEIKQSLEEAE